MLGVVTAAEDRRLVRCRTSLWIPLPDWPSSLSVMRVMYSPAPSKPNRVATSSNLFRISTRHWRRQLSLRVTCLR